MLLSLPAALLGLLASTGLVQAVNRPGQKVTPPEFVPGRYMVEFDSTANLEKAGLKRSGESVHDAVYSSLRSRGITFTILEQFEEADIFVGASISVTSVADLTSLQSTDGILNVVPVRKVFLPKSTPIMADWDLSNYKNSTVSKRQASSSGAAASRPTTGFSNLPQIQADKAQAESLKSKNPLGKGIKVGIIDGGVDYTNPVLGGCFGKGCKIAGGFDFVGDNYPNTIVNDTDPLSKCDNHGSTVAGIIAGNDNEYNVPGVAPNASLYVYRVFGCNGLGSTDDIVVKAMLRAYKDDMDVLNLSFNLLSGWTSTPLSVVASRLVQKGMIVVAAPGNDAENGFFYAQGPASGKGVISAGSYDNNIFPAHNATTSTGYGPIRYYNYKAFAAGTAGLVVPPDPTGCTNDTSVSYAGKIVVLREAVDGACNISIKSQIAFLSNQARGILYVPDQDGVAPRYNNFPLVDNAFVGKADGEYLIANAATVQLTFGYNPAPRANTLTGGLMSVFSLMGPTNDLFTSTSLMAPGTNIIGVTPINPSRFLNGFWITDGDSFSTPFAAGAAALYLAVNGKNVKPSVVREALESAAKPLTFSRSDSTLLTTVGGGAGGLATYDAIYQGTTVSPSELLLNDTAYFNNVQTITITNSGKGKKSYTVSNLPAGTVSALDPSTNFTTLYPYTQYSAPASIKFSSSSFSLNGGKSTQIKCTFTYPANVDPKSLPIISGFVQVAAAGAETLTIPYMGVAQKMKDVPVLDSTDAFFGAPYTLPLTADGATGSAFASPNPTFDLANTYPVLFYRFAGGSPVIYLDLVKADANLGFTPNFSASKRDVIAGSLDLSARDVPDSKTEITRDFTPPQGRARRVVDPEGGSASLTGLQKLICTLTKNRFSFCVTTSSFARVPVVGNLVESRLVTRSNYNYDSDSSSTTFILKPTFANGTRIPNGSYRFLLRGLHVTGNPDNQADYETYVGPQFTIVQPSS